MKKVLLLLVAVFLCSGISNAQPKKVKQMLKSFDFCDYDYDDFEQTTVLKSDECGGSGKYFVLSFNVKDDGTISKMNCSFLFVTNFKPDYGPTQSGIDLVKVRFGEFNESDKDQSEAISLPMEHFTIKGPFKTILGNTWHQFVDGSLDMDLIDKLIDKFSTNEGAEMRGYARVATDGNLYTTSSEDEDVRETVRDKDEFRSQAKFLKEYKKLVEKSGTSDTKENTTEK